VTDQPKDDEPAAAPARHRLRHLTERESKSFLQLIPRRDLVKIALLVLVLVVVVTLQRRSGSIVKDLTRGLSGPPATQVAPREPPRVRLAPPAP
jgi:hypothetical protein